MVDESNNMLEYLTVLQNAQRMIFGIQHLGSPNDPFSSEGSEGDGLFPAYSQRNSILSNDFGNDLRGLLLQFSAGTINEKDQF